VAETDFVWEDQVVYHQSNKSESIAWGVFKDGMRSLSIRRGAESDELPRFLDACQPHVKHEQALFDGIVAARDAVFGARQARDTAALGRAERELTVALQRLVALAETRPELKADDAFAALRKRLAALESGLEERRAIFNDAVQQNNVRVGRFPSNIVALLGGFRSVPPFEVERGQG